MLTQRLASSSLGVAASPSWSLLFVGKKQLPEILPQYLRWPARFYQNLGWKVTFQKETCLGWELRLAQSLLTVQLHGYLDQGQLAVVTGVPHWGPDQWPQQGKTVTMDKPSWVVPRWVGKLSWAALVISARPGALSRSIIAWKVWERLQILCIYPASACYHLHLICPNNPSHPQLCLCVCVWKAEGRNTRESKTVIRIGQIADQAKGVEMLERGVVQPQGP